MVKMDEKDRDQIVNYLLGSNLPCREVLQVVNLLKGLEEDDESKDTD